MLLMLLHPFNSSGESEIINRTLRDMYDENTKNIIIEGNEGYKKAQKLYENVNAFSG